MTVTEDKTLVATKHGEVEVVLVIEGERYPVIIQIEKLMSGLTLNVDELPSDEETGEAGDKPVIEEPVEEVIDDETAEDVTEEVVESPEVDTPENKTTSEPAAPEVKPGMKKSDIRLADFKQKNNTVFSNEEIIKKMAEKIYHYYKGKSP